MRDSPASGVTMPTGRPVVALNSTTADCGLPCAREVIVANTMVPLALMSGLVNVVVGPDVQMAVRYAIYTEVNARLQAAAIAIGGPINYISAEEGAARDRAASDFGRAWELWKKKALEK